MNDLILHTEHIYKSYGTNEVLHDINMDIPRGAIFGLVGNNGAGKTTLMRVITGLSNPDHGRYELFGQNGNAPRAKKRMGVLVDDPGFFPTFTAEENLEYFRIQFGLCGKDLVHKALETAGLKNTGKKKYKEFSMGMRQRLGLALALLNTPEFLILDEPINGIDPTGIKELRDALVRINKERNTTILISSHILAEMSNIATHYAFIHKGRIIEQLTGDELLEKSSVYLDMLVRDSAHMCTVLDQIENCSYKVYPDNHIRIYSPLDEEELLCRLAVENNVGLRRLEKKSISLENYYFTLLNKEEHHA